MKLGLKIDPTQFKRLKDRFTRIQWLTKVKFYDRLDEVLYKMLGFVVDLTPVDTGATAGGWEAKRFGGGAKGREGYLGVVRNRLAQGGSKRAEFYKMLLFILEYGSIAHVIRPKHLREMSKNQARRRVRAGNAEGVLVFKTDDGETVFTRLVHHPGTRPYGMVRLTAARARGWLREVVQQIAADYARDFGRP